MIHRLHRIVILRGLVTAILLFAHGIELLPKLHVARAAPIEAMIRGFPSVTQWYSLSCEYAAAAAVTLYWGDVVSQRDFIREIPKHPNPHIGFRGNIHGPHGGVRDYGIYAEPLVPVLEQHGYGATVFYGGVSRLKANLAAGNPVVVWITTGRYEERPVYRFSHEGETFKLVPYEHTVVAYGYDDGGIYLMDVGDGGFYYTEWSSFLRRWSYFDQMALVIYPE
jgi:uncharacterized protein YvpB